MTCSVHVKELWSTHKCSQVGPLFVSLLCRSSKDDSETSEKFSEGPMAKKHAGDKKLLEKKKKDKKKTLKRL